MRKVRVKIYKAHDRYYVGVNPLELSKLKPGTSFTIICPPDASSHFKQDHHWRRQRWHVTIYPAPDKPTAFVLQEEAALTPDEAAYFEGLE